MEPLDEAGPLPLAPATLFDLLEAASGLLLVAFAVLLVPVIGRRSRTLRWAVRALVAVGVCTLIDGAFPLSCGEALAAPCELRYDAIDIVHGVETLLSIAITIATSAPSAACTDHCLGFFDGSGMCLFYKRLDRGVFRLPEARSAEARHVEVDESLLDALLDGVDLAEAPKRAPRSRIRVH